MHCIRKVLFSQIENFKDSQLNAVNSLNNDDINLDEPEQQPGEEQEQEHAEQQRQQPKKKPDNKHGWLYIVRCAGWKPNVYKFGMSVKGTLHDRMNDYQQSGFQKATVLASYLCFDVKMIEKHLMLHLFGFHLGNSLEFVCMPLEVLQQTMKNWLVRNEEWSNKISQYLGENYSIFNIRSHRCDITCSNIKQLKKWDVEVRKLNGTYEVKCHCAAYDKNSFAGFSCGVCNGESQENIEQEGYNEENSENNMDDIGEENNVQNPNIQNNNAQNNNRCPQESSYLLDGPHIPLSQEELHNLEKILTLDQSLSSNQVNANSDHIMNSINNTLDHTVNSKSSNLMEGITGTSVAFEGLHFVSSLAAPDTNKSPSAKHRSDISDKIPTSSLKLRKQRVISPSAFINKKG